MITFMLRCFRLLSFQTFFISLPAIDTSRRYAFSLFHYFLMIFFAAGFLRHAERQRHSTLRYFRWLSHNIIVTLMMLSNNSLIWLIDARRAASSLFHYCFAIISPSLSAPFFTPRFTPRYLIFLSFTSLQRHMMFRDYFASFRYACYALSALLIMRYATRRYARYAMPARHLRY